jgi:hypothetical protein
LKTHTFSDDDFQCFVEAVHYWMKELGLTEWAFVVEHDQIGDGISANVSSNPKTKTALFRLSKVAEYDYCTGFNVRELALHEVLHLLFADFGWVIAQAKDEYANVVISHEHEMIHRLIKVIGWFDHDRP